MEHLENTNTVATMSLTTDKCLKALLFSRGKGRVGGQTTVEFALICLPFFIILFAIVDFAEIYFYENSLQNALREAARFATSGRIIQTTNSAGAPAYTTNAGGVVVPKAISSKYSVSSDASRNECIRYWFLSNCVLANFPISNIVITSAPTLPGVPANVSTNSLGQLILLSGYTVTTNSGVVSTNSVPAVKGPGGANDYVQITATYKVNTITPLMGYIGGYGGVANVFPVHVSAIVKNEPALLNFQHLAMYTNEP